MKVYNEAHNEPLKPGLQKLLDKQRRIRGFDPAIWVAAKAKLINDYIRNSGLKSAVVGLSGGIDSSVVTALADFAKNLPGSPIEKIVPIMIPVFTASATGQDTAVARGRDVVTAYGLDEHVVDLAAAHTALTGAVEASLGIEGDNWARGQAVAHARTAALSYSLSLMSKSGQPGILLGTTNRSEGAYLGYVGKYSDGMVDLQVISDLFKSEVYAVARYLNLPQSVLDAIPTGDMYDARSDTEVFGASYDFVELYHGFLEYSEEEKARVLASFTPDERAQFDMMAAGLEKLHKYNGHKYHVGSPAYHLDIQASGVPGGWKTGLFNTPLATPKSTDGFVGYFKLSDKFLDTVAGNDPDVIASRLAVTAPDDASPSNASILQSLLTEDEAAALIAETTDQDWEPVGDDGIKGNFKDGVTRVGSWRLTTYNEKLATLLWERIAGRIPMTQIIPDGMQIDAKGAEVWRAVGINPAFRFIKYDPVGENRLVAHVDAPPSVDLGDNRTSLQSLVLYLTDTQPGTGGLTRFLHDPQKNVAPGKRDLSDWLRPAANDEVLAAIAPQAGTGTIFNHRVLHDSQPLTRQASEKIIVRSDIIWKGIRLP